MAQTGTSRPAASDQSLGDLVALAAKDISQLIRGEISLAKIELRGDLTRVIVAAVLLFLAAFVACLMLVLLLFGFAFGLVAVGIWQWAAFLIVAGVCLVPDQIRHVSAIMKEVHAIRRQLQECGQWVFAGGLHPASTAGTSPALLHAWHSPLCTTTSPGFNVTC